jgi:hypothetical protein
MTPLLLSLTLAAVGQPPAPPVRHDILTPAPLPEPPVHFPGVVPPVAPDAPAPRPLPPPRPVEPTPFVVPLPPAVEVPLRCTEFMKVFKPCPGKYEVLFVHMKTGCPVKVCFTLPDCCCKRVYLGWRSLNFDYGRQEVSILFRLNGKTDVVYR